MNTWRINLFFALGIGVIILAFFIAIRPPSGSSPNHPFVGRWEFEHGQEGSFQNIILAPSKRVFIDGVIRGTYTISPATISLVINNTQIEWAFEVQNDRLYIYQDEELVSTYRRIDHCWSPTLANTCE
jgi:hypothetical protein